MRGNMITKLCTVLTILFAMSLICGSMGMADTQNTGEKVNINMATVKELSALPGIGKKKAEAIIAYRNENGKFTAVDDLRKVEGIGKKTVEKIRELITAEGS